MAKREYSSTLMHLKFMQRAQQKEEAVKKAEEEAAADDSHWVAPTTTTSSPRKCVVIMEGDPKPSALLGRMSFQNCNASIDKLTEEAESVLKKRLLAAKDMADNTTTSTAKSETLRDSRCESRNGKDGQDKNTEDSKSIQNKKQKLVDTGKSVDGGSSQETKDKNKKPWQGWRSEGDYRILKSRH